MFIDNVFFNPDIGFTSFSQSHLGAMIVFVLFAISFVNTAQRLDDRQNLLLTRLASIFISLTVIVWTSIHIAYGRFDPAVNLTLSICNIFALVAPLLFWHTASDNHARSGRWLTQLWVL